VSSGIGSDGIVEIFLPPGGTAGQVLAKIDTQNYNATWSNAGGGPSGGAFTAVSAGTTDVTTGALSFANSPTVTFGLNGSTITASANVTGGGAPFANSAGTQSVSTGTVVLANSNGISFGMSGSSQITASYTVPSTAGLLSAINLSAGTTSQNLSAATFSNSNNVSFGLNGSVVTASASFPAQTTQPVAVSGSNGSFSFGTLTLGNSNGIGFYTTNGSVVASYTVPSTAGLISAINLSAGTTSGNLSAFTLSNSNGLAFGLNAGTVTGSYTVPTVTDYFSKTNTTFNGANVSGSLTLNTNGLQMSLSVAPPGAANINLSAGTTSNNLTAFTLGNANNVSFGLNGSTVTASASFAAQTNQTEGVYAVGNTTGQSSSSTYDARTLSISGAGAASVGWSNGSLLVSVPTQSVQTQGLIQAVYDGANSVSSGTLRLTNANGVSFSLNGQTLSASVQAQTNQSLGIYASSQTTGQSSSSTYDARSLSIVGDGIVSLGWSNGSLRVSATQSNQALSGSNGSFTFQTATFGNLNGMSFYTSNGSVVGSYTVPAAGVSQATMYATGNTTQSSTGTQALSSLIFSGAGIASVGVTGGSVIISVPSGGGAGDGVNIVQAGTTGTTGTTWSSISATVQLNGSGALTVSQNNSNQIVISAPQTSSLSATGLVSISTNGSTISIGVPGGITLSYFNPQDGYVQVTGQQGQASLHIQPARFPDVQFDRIMMPIVNMNSNNSSGSHTLSFWWGLYTRNASTLSLVTSTSSSTAVTHSGTAGSYSLYFGVRFFSIPMTYTIPASQYWVGILSRTTSGGANGSYSQIVASQQNSSFFGHFGVAVNATMQYTRGLGTYSASTSGMPGSIAFSQINGANNSMVLRQPMFYVVSGTV